MRKNNDIDDLLELFVVSAVASIFIIRFILHLTGYPTLGGNDFHIAHMLWGGLLMGISILLVLIYRGKVVLQTIAILGGVGFGVFIDELGKFVTVDNDYFFKPTFSLIYLLFVSSFFLVKYLATNENQLSSGYEKLLDSLYVFKDSLERRLIKFSDLKNIVPIAKAVVLVAAGGSLLHWIYMFNTGFLLPDWVLLAGVISSLVELVLGFLGYLKSDRKYFRASVLVALLLSQFFLFYASEILGVYRLVIYLPLLLVYRKRAL